MLEARRGAEVGECVAVAEEGTILEASGDAREEEYDWSDKDEET